MENIDLWRIEMHIRLTEFDACVEALKNSNLDLNTWGDEILGDIVELVLKTIKVEVGI